MLDGAIDVHCHFLPPAYATALADAGLKAVDGNVPIPSWSEYSALGLMDEIGVERSILSISSPFLGFENPDRAKPLARTINDCSANLAFRHGSRFGGFAVLPLHDVDAAIDEACHALDDLALDGVALPTSFHGTYPGDALFAPLWDVLAERRATVFLHPTAPCCFEAIGLGLPAPMMEFPFETARAVVSLIYSKTLARHQDRIRLIVPHLGGPLPALIARITRIGAAPFVGEQSLDQAVAMASFERLFFDTAGLSDARQFEAARLFVPPSQMVFGTDYPFTPAARVREMVDLFEGLTMSATERAGILSGNAERLFGRD